MKCKRCSVEVSRKEYSNESWRLYRRNFTRKQVLAVVPLCRTCMDFWIYDNCKNYRTVSWRDYTIPEGVLDVTAKYG